jgi:hypothetical protein
MQSRLDVNGKAGSSQCTHVAINWSVYGNWQRHGGSEVELEQIESAHKSYPATIPFLKLLSTLIHTSKQLYLQDQVAGTESLNTIPESLGQPYRLPGIGPFISFVIDNVFAKIPNLNRQTVLQLWTF